MSYVAADLEHRMATTNGWVGINTECVALVRAWSNAPPSGGWVKGAKVQGNAHLARGTVIATFEHGHYHGHAAIFLNETADGIRVYDQWNSQKAHVRVISYSGKHAFVDDGTNYYVVE